MRLVVYPKPVPGQSPACYMRSLARCNGFASVAMFSRLFFGSDKIDTLCLTREELTNSIGRPCTHVDGLNLLTACQDSRSHEYGSLRLPRHQLVKAERYCPECVREAGVCKDTWTIGWLPMCTKHQRPLKAATPAVERILFEGGTRLCQSLDDAPGLMADYASLTETQLNLEDRLRRESCKHGGKESSIVDEIDRHLLMSMRLDTPVQLRQRKRRYAVQYFPYELSDSLRFLECLTHQLVA